MSWTCPICVDQTVFKYILNNKLYYACGDCGRAWSSLDSLLKHQDKEFGRLKKIIN